jgi:hypothetical protein
MANDRFQLNFLSNGDVVTATASDFVGSVVGESQKKTNQGPIL